MKKRILSNLVFAVFIVFISLSVSVNDAEADAESGIKHTCNDSEMGHEVFNTCCYSTDTQYPLCG